MWLRQPYWLLSIRELLRRKWNNWSQSRLKGRFSLCGVSIRSNPIHITVCRRSISNWVPQLRPKKCRKCGMNSGVRYWMFSRNCLKGHPILKFPMILEMFSVSISLWQPTKDLAIMTWGNGDNGWKPSWLRSKVCRRWPCSENRPRWSMFLFLCRNWPIRGSTWIRWCRPLNHRIRWSIPEKREQEISSSRFWLKERTRIWPISKISWFLPRPGNKSV